MKSNICRLTSGTAGYHAAWEEVNKCAEYNDLGKKEMLRLRLLAEELLSMLPELTKNFEGVFWIENTGRVYELHAEFSVAKMSIEQKENLIAVSRTGKNAAAAGIMGKIRCTVQNMLLFTGSPDEAVVPQIAYEISPEAPLDRYTMAWTLEQYKKRVEDRAEKDAWDELEKSIIANLADDVVVGVKGKRVDIVVKKEFS